MRLRERVALHQARRRKRWLTFEAPYAAEEILPEAGARTDAILFDDITIYLSNMLYGKNAPQGTTAEKALYVKKTHRSASGCRCGLRQNGGICVQRGGSRHRTGQSVGPGIQGYCGLGQSTDRRCRRSGLLGDRRPGSGHQKTGFYFYVLKSKLRSKKVLPKSRTRRG